MYNYIKTLSLSSIIITIIIFISLINTATEVVYAQENEYDSWTDLRNDPPEWYKDAKFGIYFHWGIYSVPAYHSEWYSRNMYNPGSQVYDYHVSTYGPLHEFGYKDFVPGFKAEKFDADEWVDLFVRAGARFTGPVAEHADGFSMWDSEVNSWNSKKRGPNIDVVAEMERAVRNRGLKFITTFHHQWHWGWYPTFKSIQEADAGNPEYSELYGPLVNTDTWRHRSNALRPDNEFNQLFTDKVLEVIDGYQPDMIYFDSRFGHIGEEYRKTIVERFLKSMDDRGESGQGVILYKHEDLPAHSGVFLMEKARMTDMGDRIWQSEEPITTFAWNYYEGMELRPAEDILHSLIDIVAKNGVYMLNIGPRADGTIPQDQVDILLDIGDWLDKYGEAIYATRPWYTYGEGPRKEAEQTGEDNDLSYYELQYSFEDVRYTTNDDIIYGILLGRPGHDSSLLLASFSAEQVSERTDITNVSLLGSQNQVQWELSDEGLSISLPDDIPEDMALVLKIETTSR